MTAIFDVAVLSTKLLQHMASREGLEPPLCRLTVYRFNQLDYRDIFI